MIVFFRLVWALVRSRFKRKLDLLACRKHSMEIWTRQGIEQTISRAGAPRG